MAEPARRLIYPDLLRILAMAAVVTLHVAMRDLQDVPIGSPSWQVMNFYDGAARWCVPIYVMVSGMFLLRPARNVDDLRQAYRKAFGRALRLASILVIWSVVYQGFALRATRKPVTVEGVVSALWEMWFSPIYYHLWFLYMLVPLYFLAPLLQVFIARTDPVHQRWLVLVLFVGGPVLTLVTTLVQIITGEGVYRVMPEYTGYLFYFLLGWWLSTVELDGRWRRWTMLGGLLGLAVTIGGTWWASRAVGRFHDGFYNYLALPTVLVAAAVFVLVRHASRAWQPSPRTTAAVTGASALTLGIYLLHPALIETFFRLTDLNASPSPIPEVIWIPLVTALVFTASMLLAWLVRRVVTLLPRGKDWVGWVI